MAKFMNVCLNKTAHLHKQFRLCELKHTVIRGIRYYQGEYETISGYNISNFITHKNVDVS